MIRKRWLTMVTVVGIATTVTGCKDPELRNLMKQGGEMYLWLNHLQYAVCQLEEKSTGLDTTKRVCPNGADGPDIKPPPSYPR